LWVFHSRTGDCYPGDRAQTLAIALRHCGWCLFKPAADKAPQSVLFTIVLLGVMCGRTAFCRAVHLSACIAKAPGERIFSLFGKDNPYSGCRPNWRTQRRLKKKHLRLQRTPVEDCHRQRWRAGQRLLNGTQTRYDFVPEQRTDFIFCTIGEGFGFVGTSILLSIYLILLFRIVAVAERQRSVFSRCYAYGVAAVFFFHIAINVCMTVGLAPVIGIPLPFVSYGGTALLTFTILLFILIRLDADRQMVLR
jgi:rod shape determining protein RodA